MVKSYSRYIGSQRVLLLLAFTVVFCGLLKPAYCQTNSPVLLLQQIPPDGGTITPGPGVHYLELDTRVTLTAVPRPGYQFVYWLGDVTEPELNRTTAYLDAPKIIIALFERAEFDLEDLSEPTQSIPGGLGGSLSASATDYSRQGYSGGGAGRQSVSRPPAQPPGPEPLPPPEVPVPVPEPTTLVLLAVGSYLAFAASGSRK